MDLEDNGQVRVTGEPSEDWSSEATRSSLIALRQFHLGMAEQAGDELAAGFVPALLQSCRDRSFFRAAYPLLLSAQLVESGGAQPVSDYLAATVPTTARILSDNRLRFERQLQLLLTGELANRLVPAADAMAKAAEAVQAEVQLSGEPAEQLRVQLDALIDGLPEDGQILGFSATAPLHLLVDQKLRQWQEREQILAAEIKTLVQGLANLLQVEAGKDVEASGAGSLQREVGSTGAALLDASSLAEVLGEHRGSELMEPDRRVRVSAALATLQGYLQQSAEAPVILVYPEDDPQMAEICSPLESVVDLRPVTDPLAELPLIFDGKARTMAGLFKALRIAQLELTDDYRPEIHDAYLRAFDWSAFSRDETLAIPSVIGWERSARLIDRMQPLTQLMLSSRPVELLVLADPIAVDDERSPSRFADHRLELGYLGIAHRVALVHQGSVAKPLELIRGFALASSSTRSALHLIDGAAAEDAGAIHPLIRAGAAVDSRAQPLFCFDPEAGSSWKRQLDIDGNPDSELHWSQGELLVDEESGTETSMALSFTFADYALLDSRSSADFMLLPTGFAHEALMPLQDYLELDEEDSAARIPYLLAVDGAERLCRLAVSRSLSRAARDRLAFWHCLQELAGINNEYAELASDAARQEAQAEATAEREELEARHRQEIDNLRESATSDAMQGLASMLLDLDVDSLSNLGSASTVIPAAGARGAAPAASEAELEEQTAVSAEQVTPEQAAPVAEEEPSFDEAWVDTPLCTSCDDCITINPRMFSYDENKQVVMGDPSAGTFAQLVAAAEKCPAKCIHPGKPLDPNEANLEQLLKRVAELK